MSVPSSLHISPHLSAETYVIDLDRHINRNVIPSDLAVEGKSTIQ